MPSNNCYDRKEYPAYNDINELQPPIRESATRIIDFLNRVANEYGFTCRLEETWRTDELSDCYNRIGTGVEGGKSWHNHGYALDIVVVTNGAANYDYRRQHIEPANLRSVNPIKGYNGFYTDGSNDNYYWYHYTRNPNNGQLNGDAGYTACNWWYRVHISWHLFWLKAIDEKWQVGAIWSVEDFVDMGHIQKTPYDSASRWRSLNGNYMPSPTPEINRELNLDEHRNNMRETWNDYIADRSTGSQEGKTITRDLADDVINTIKVAINNNDVSESVIKSLTVTYDYDVCRRPVGISPCPFGGSFSDDHAAVNNDNPFGAGAIDLIYNPIWDDNNEDVSATVEEVAGKYIVEPVSRWAIAGNWLENGISAIGAASAIESGIADVSETQSIPGGSFVTDRIIERSVESDTSNAIGIEKVQLIGFFKLLGLFKLLCSVSSYSDMAIVKGDHYQNTRAGANDFVIPHGITGMVYKDDEDPYTTERGSTITGWVSNDAVGYFPEYAPIVSAGFLKSLAEAPWWRYTSTIEEAVSYEGARILFNRRNLVVLYIPPEVLEMLPNDMLWDTTNSSGNSPQHRLRDYPNGMVYINNPVPPDKRSWLSYHWYVRTYFGKSQGGLGNPAIYPMDYTTVNTSARTMSWPIVEKDFLHQTEDDLEPIQIESGDIGGRRVIHDITYVPDAYIFHPNRKLYSKPIMHVSRRRSYIFAGSTKKHYPIGVRSEINGDDVNVSIWSISESKTHVPLRDRHHYTTTVKLSALPSNEAVYWWYPSVGPRSNLDIGILGTHQIQANRRSAIMLFRHTHYGMFLDKHLNCVEDPINGIEHTMTALWGSYNSMLADASGDYMNSSYKEYPVLSIERMEYFVNHGLLNINLDEQSKVPLVSNYNDILEMFRSINNDNWMPYCTAILGTDFVDGISPMVPIPSDFNDEQYMRFYTSSSITGAMFNTIFDYALPLRVENCRELFPSIENLESGSIESFPDGKAPYVDKYPNPSDLPVRYPNDNRYYGLWNEHTHYGFGGSYADNFADWTYMKRQEISFPDTPNYFLNGFPDVKRNDAYIIEEGDAHRLGQEVCDGVKAYLSLFAIQLKEILAECVGDVDITSFPDISYVHVAGGPGTRDHSCFRWPSQITSSDESGNLGGFAFDFRYSPYPNGDKLEEAIAGHIYNLMEVLSELYSSTNSDFAIIGSTPNVDVEEFKKYIEDLSTWLLYCVTMFAIDTINTNLPEKTVTNIDVDRNKLIHISTTTHQMAVVTKKATGSRQDTVVHVGFPAEKLHPKATATNRWVSEQEMIKDRPVKMISWLMTIENDDCFDPISNAIIEMSPVSIADEDTSLIKRLIYNLDAANSDEVRMLEGNLDEFGNSIANLIYDPFNLSRFETTLDNDVIKKVFNTTMLIIMTLVTTPNRLFNETVDSLYNGKYNSYNIKGFCKALRAFLTRSYLRKEDIVGLDYKKPKQCNYTEESGVIQAIIGPRGSARYGSVTWDGSGEGEDITDGVIATAAERMAVVNPYIEEAVRIVMTSTYNVYNGNRIISESNKGLFASFLRGIVSQEYVATYSVLENELLIPNTNVVYDRYGSHINRYKNAKIFVSTEPREYNGLIWPISYGYSQIYFVNLPFSNNKIDFYRTSVATSGIGGISNLGSIPRKDSLQVSATNSNGSVIINARDGSGAYGTYPSAEACPQWYGHLIGEKFIGVSGPVGYMSSSVESVLYMLDKIKYILGLNADNRTVIGDIYKVWQWLPMMYYAGPRTVYSTSESGRGVLGIYLDNNPQVDDANAYTYDQYRSSTLPKPDENYTYKVWKYGYKINNFFRELADNELQDYGISGREWLAPANFMGS